MLGIHIWSFQSYQLHTVKSKVGRAHHLVNYKSRHIHVHVHVHVHVCTRCEATALIVTSALCAISVNVVPWSDNKGGESLPIVEM